MAPYSVYSLLALIAASLIGLSFGQCSSGPMQYNQFGAPTEKCTDDSIAGYYYQAGTNNKIIIWLGDSDLCQDKSSCDLFCQKAEGCKADAYNRNLANVDEIVDCYYGRQTCGSQTGDWDNAVVNPESILCGDADSPFKDYHRVYIPQCSHDWFLGTGTTPFGDQYFNGANILTEILGFIKTGLPGLTHAVIGGTRGGGIGALNSIRRIKDNDLLGTNVEVISVIDGAWFPNLPEFALKEFNNPDNVYRWFRKLELKVENWIEDHSLLDEDCRAYWSQTGEAPFLEGPLVNCLFPSTLLETSTFLKSTPVFVSQSQYDLLLLSTYGARNETKADIFEDDEAYASNVLQYIEQFGANIRNSFEQSSKSNDGSHYFFGPSCGQYGGIVPTDFHTIPSRTEAVQLAGSLTYSRLPDYWNIKIKTHSLKDLLFEFIDSGGSVTSPSVTEFRNGVIIDRCGSFQCNEGCTSSMVINPYILEVETPIGAQGTILFIALGFLLAGAASFSLYYFQVLVFRGRYKSIWKKLEKEIGNMDNETVKIEVEKMVASKQRMISLMITKLSYFAPPRKRGGPVVQILKQVSVCTVPGQVHALMGPAGSGKSTVLDMLAYTREDGRTRGTHYINGVPSHYGRAKFLREWLRNNVSYVRQQDFLFPHLTVKEHLTHAAWLMLPQNMRARDKIRRIYLIAKLLNIDSTLNIKCGDGGVKMEGGISGGQRRRVSVATQLLQLPAALVLDEPTSGLDSANALSLVEVLHNLAENANVNVLMTIHQPRTTIFDLFHKMTILNAGQVTFSGTPEEAKKFFNIKDAGSNIGNEILDKLKHIQDNRKRLAYVQKHFHNGPLGKKLNHIIAGEKTDLTADLAKSLKKELVSNALQEGRMSWTRPTGFNITVKTLFSRTILRGGFDILRTGLTAAFGGFLVGTVFIGTDTYQMATALAYLVIASMAFLQSTFLGDRYQLEKGMWAFEKENGTVVDWKAFLTSLFTRNIVSSTFEGLCFAIPPYFMGGLNPDTERFVLFLLLLVLVANTVIAQNTFIEISIINKGSGSGPDVRQAAILQMFFISIGTLFNGFIIPLKDIPVYIQWVSYCMFVFWGFVGIIVNNFLNFSYPCDVSVLECVQRTGDNWVRTFEYDVFDVYQCIIALCAMLLVFHVASVANFYRKFIRNGNKLSREEDDGKEEVIPKGKIGKSMAKLLNVEYLRNSAASSGRISGLSSPNSPNQYPSLSQTNQFSSPQTSKTPPFPGRTAPRARPVRPTRAGVPSLSDI